MCCQKLVIAQKYSAEVQQNFSTCSAPSAKTLVSAKHYKGMFGAPLFCGMSASSFVLSMLLWVWHVTWLWVDMLLVVTCDWQVDMPSTLWTRLSSLTITLLLYELYTAQHCSCQLYCSQVLTASIMKNSAVWGKKNRSVRLSASLSLCNCFCHLF